MTISKFTIDGPDMRMEIGALTIHTADAPGAWVVRLIGELDLESAEPLEAELMRLMQAETNRGLVDLAELTFIDSTGLRCLMRVVSRTPPGSGKFALRGSRGQVSQVMKLTKVGRVLPFID